MSILVTCPNGHKHKVKDRYAGKLRLCPVCRAPIHIPGKDELSTKITTKKPNKDSPKTAGKKKSKDAPKPADKKKSKDAPKPADKKKSQRFDDDDILDILMD